MESSIMGLLSRRVQQAKVAGCDVQVSHLAIFLTAFCKSSGKSKRPMTAQNAFQIRVRSCVLGGHYGIISTIALEGDRMISKYRDRAFCNSRGSRCMTVCVASTANIGVFKFFAR